ncbi:MAG: glycerate kinase [Actinobacteria bacterium]|nr:glycerate kinase [Actinomycetota bacterium]
MSRVVVAPDSFKSNHTAADVAAAIARGARSAGAEPVELPAADGGEGTMEAIVRGRGGEVREATVADPLGRPVPASWAMLADGRTGVVEMAQASGLWRVGEDERDAWGASTRGTGQLIAAAAAAGAQLVIVGVGGSATTDGGAGALAALDEAGVDVALDVVCDVQTPWEDAPSVFAPQKGADPQTVARLERRLDELAARAPRDPRGVPMTGCAGGLSGGLWAWRGARLLPGAAYVLDAIGFDAEVERAAFVITGEGRIDRQTQLGKLVGEVAARAARAGRACHAVVAIDDLGEEGRREMGLASVRAVEGREEMARAGADIAAAELAAGGR